MAPRDRKDSILYVRFQARLKQLREAEGLTQEELMAKIGWTGDSSNVSQIEGGHRGISLERIDELAAHFKVDPVIFFTEIDPAMEQKKPGIGY